MRPISRLTTAIAAAACSSLIAAGAALADDEERKFEWSITMGGTSDYVFRGLSLHNEDPAFQPSINMSYGIFYAGAWGSNVSGEGYAPYEVDLYAGIKPELGPVTFDFGAVWYVYPGADEGGSLGLDYVELKAGAEYSPFTNFTLTPVFWYAPEQGSHYPEAYAIEGTAAYELPACGIFTPTISALIGYSDDLTNSGYYLGHSTYTYWNAGVALDVEKITFDLRYWDTNINDDGTADARFVFSASVTLP